MTFNTSIDNIKIPLLIPRRGKGHSEVICKCTANTDCMLDSISFVSFFRDIAKETCLNEIPLQLGKKIVKNLKLATLTMTMEFIYSLDRVSASFETIYYPLKCKYTVIIREHKAEQFMSVYIPVLVHDVPISRAGILEFGLRAAKGVYFEDMIDCAQKYADVNLYPIAVLQDKDELGGKLGHGKTAYQYLTALQDAAKQKSLAPGGYAIVYINDVYGIYDTTYKAEW